MKRISKDHIEWRAVCSISHHESWHIFVYKDNRINKNYAFLNISLSLRITEFMDTKREKGITAPLSSNSSGLERATVTSASDNEGMG